mgnify:CR=1 FL=1
MKEHAVSACIVTRGNVDLEPVLASLPKEWERVVWDNSVEEEDMAVYGRYEAIYRASAPLIYVQDDDAILQNPGALVDHWLEAEAIAAGEHVPSPGGFAVVNMPARFRHEFYVDHSLVGFGAVFPRELPELAFSRFLSHATLEAGVFDRTCDIVFTALTPCVRVDEPYTDREFASDPDRMWKQPTHFAERLRVLGTVRDVRDVHENLAPAGGRFA